MLVTEQRLEFLWGLALGRVIEGNAGIVQARHLVDLLETELLDQGWTPPKEDDGIQYDPAK